MNPNCIPSMFCKERVLKCIGLAWDDDSINVRKFNVALYLNFGALIFGRNQICKKWRELIEMITVFRLIFIGAPAPRRQTGNCA